jgi:hypothetical protein
MVGILRAAKPRFVYTHNLADKHDTHVAVALRVIEALRRLEGAERPERVVGCEVWRGLDWLMDSDKVLMDLSAHENMQFALLGVFDSQIAGWKTLRPGFDGTPPRQCHLFRVARRRCCRADCPSQWI